MDKSLLEKVQEGDAISVALRGGAGWVHGTLVWRREGIMLLQSQDKEVRKETPYVIVLLADCSAVAVPHKIDPPGAPERLPGFLRQ